jgi:hypothetical protein
MNKPNQWLFEATLPLTMDIFYPDANLGNEWLFETPSSQGGGWFGAKGQPNTSEIKVGQIRRIPIDGLTLGNQKPNKASETQDLANGKAIILTPQVLGEKTDPGQIEILLHLHGHNIGYRKRSKQGSEGGMRKGSMAPVTVRDITVDRIEQQLDANERTQIIGVLPQGTNISEFGTKGLDCDAYISEVLNKMQLLTKWSELPNIKRVLLSAHSGGGGRIAEMLAGKKGKLPANMNALFLFDAINGSNELAIDRDWLLGQLNSDLATLLRLARTHPFDPGKNSELQRQYLNNSLRFRAYYTNTSYVPRHLKLKEAIDNWFKKNETLLKGSLTVGSGIYDRLRDNYQVIPVGHIYHDAIVGGAVDGKGKPIGLADPLKFSLGFFQPTKRLNISNIQYRVDREVLPASSQPATIQNLNPIRADEHGKILVTFARKSFTIFVPTAVILGARKEITDVKVHVFFAAAGVQGNVANDVLVHGLRGASDSSSWVLIAVRGVKGRAVPISDSDINDCLASIGLPILPSQLRLSGHSRGADSLMASILGKKITNLSIIDRIFILDAADKGKIPKLIGMGIPLSKITAYQVNVRVAKQAKGVNFIDLKMNDMAAIGYVRLIQDAMIVQPGISALINGKPDISKQITSLSLPARGSFSTGIPAGNQVGLQAFSQNNSSAIQQIIKFDSDLKKGLLPFINRHDLAKFRGFKFSRGIAAHHFFVAEVAHELTQ